MDFEPIWAPNWGASSIKKSVQNQFIDKTNDIKAFLVQNWVNIVVFLGPLEHFCLSFVCYKIDNGQKKY